ncbi:MAG: hypothetical protein ABIH41_07175 [Nanoarchaeota archaeon]
MKKTIFGILFLAVLVAAVGVASQPQFLHVSRDAQCNPEGIGYWKQPCLGHFTHESEVTMLARLSDIELLDDYFDGRIDDLEQACIILNPDEPASTTQRAEQHLLATWLNIASGRMPFDAIIDFDGLTNATNVQDAVDYAESIIGSDPETAKDIAERINEDDYLTACTGGFDCYSPLDYVYPNGIQKPDRQHSLSDAVVFTLHYLTETDENLSTSTTSADVNGDGIVDGADYDCAVKYYGRGLYQCGLVC